MKKKIVTLLVVIGMMGGMNTNVIAAEGNTAFVQEMQHDSSISIMMTNITKQENKLSISESHVATIRCSVVGLNGITKTSITATLQKKTGNSWTNIKTWTATTNSNKTTLSKTKGVASGSSYRVKATFKAYKGKTCETKTTFSAVKKG